MKHLTLKRVFSVLLALIMVISLVVPTLGTSAYAANGNYEIQIGETVAMPKAEGNATWSTSNSSVASVSNDGIVTGVGEGTATITVTIKEEAAPGASYGWFGFWFHWFFSWTKTTQHSYTVTVVKPVQPEEPGASFELKVGETLALPKTANGAQWSSSDNQIATVSNDGVVTGVKAGTVTVTETARTGGNWFTSFFWFFPWWNTTTTTHEYTITVLNADEPQPPEETPVPETPEPTATPEPTPATPAAEYQITFETNGGSPVDAQTVKDGDLAVRPDNPSREGYHFVGWYLDPSFTLVYHFTSEVHQDMTLYARWVNDQDNLADDLIDLADIEELKDNGTVELVFREDGSLQTIDGPFTDTVVTDAKSAAALLNSASPLFGDYFKVEEAQIESKIVDDGLLAEHFFNYNPSLNGIPVLGSQIVLSTNEVGDVNGLFSMYRDEIHSVNLSDEIGSEAAKQAALEQYFHEDEIDAILNEAMADGVTRDQLESELLKLLTVQSRILVFAADQDMSPVLAYEVHVTNLQSVNNNDDESYDNTIVDHVYQETGNIIDTAGGDGLPIVSRTYYIYANDDQQGTVFKKLNQDLEWSLYELTAKDKHGVERTVYGQGQDGVYRLKDPIRNIETYQATETKTDDGFLFWKKSIYAFPGEIASTSNLLWMDMLDVHAFTLHANLSDVYDYYKNNLNRMSYDGKGKKIIATSGYLYDNAVLEDTPGDYHNACWHPYYGQFIFGKGDYEFALDVVGHEFTHAVIEYSVPGNNGLFYEGESGALNESYADIMGSIIEGKSGDGRWLLGEDADRTSRSFSDPGKYNQADHYDDLSDPDWNSKLNRYVNRDNGGVHIFSGVYNLASYKMMTDTRTSGISESMWARVFYRSLYRMTSTSDFMSARCAVIASAKVLGFTGTQLQAIKDAYDAVGIKEPDTIRIVLRWGESPRDLDSHLVGPAIDGSGRFHVYFGDRSYYEDGSYSSDNSSYVVDLDYDDTDSYGPEITTIHSFTPGVYYFYVHDYTNGSQADSVAMAASGANVKVFRGTSNRELQSYTVDPNSKGTYWNVMKITITDSGDVSFETINTYGSSPIYN